jgi:hypothetical protein
MTMTPAPRKFALVVHVASSVGWFGAAAAYIALDVAAAASQDVQLVRAAYLAMELVAAGRRGGHRPCPARPSAGVRLRVWVR